MSDHTLSVAAASIELGVPLLLLVSCVFAPSARLRSVIVLGATSPLLAAYGYVLVGYYVVQNEQLGWAVGAMWIMSFVPFVACAFLGAAMSFTKRPTNPSARYLVGASASLLGALLIVAGV